ncbi:hypothetical protein MNBD_PLANCTO02-1587, partial [hydrothermal vent metagenome]
MGRFRIPFFSRRRRSSRRFFPRIGRLFIRPIVWLRRFLWQITLLIFTPFRVFAQAWKRRQTKHLLQGIPALLIFGLVITLAVFVNLRQSDLPDYYRDVAVLAFKNNQFEAAKIYFERLIELEGTTKTNQFDLLRVLLKTEEMERATAILNRLAPANQSGYPQAHHWKAQQLLGQWKEDVLKLKITPKESSDRLKVIYGH